MVNIKGVEYTQQQLESMVDLIGELISINEEQNAKLIAFDAKLKNEEKKVIDLNYKLAFLQQSIINNYKA